MKFSMADSNKHIRVVEHEFRGLTFRVVSAFSDLKSNEDVYNVGREFMREVQEKHGPSHKYCFDLTGKFPRVSFYGQTQRFQRRLEESCSHGLTLVGVSPEAREYIDYLRLDCLFEFEVTGQTPAEYLEARRLELEQAAGSGTRDLRDNSMINL